MDLHPHANVILQTQILPSEPCCELRKNGNIHLTALFLLFCDIPVVCVASFRTSYSSRTIALFFIVAVLVHVYVFCAHKFIVFQREQSVKALKLRWICAIVLLLISVAFPACLHSMKLPRSCRVLGWTMFGIHLVGAVLGNVGYILNKYGQKAVYPIGPDILA